MCLITFAWAPDGLELWANRDEFYARPTQPAQLWIDQRTWSGVDLQAGGTWLAIQSGGRMAALTNIRDPKRITGRLSRGAVVADFMRTQASASAYFAGLDRDAYGGFNLLLMDQHGLWFGSSDEELRPLEYGIYGLSNATLNTPWPKLTAVCQAWQDQTVEQAMRNPQPYPDHELPDTGIPIEWERRLSAAFIESADYGTRALTHVRFTDGTWDASETSFGPIDGRRCIQGL